MRALGLPGWALPAFAKGFGAVAPKLACLIRERRRKGPLHY
jgi:hypothetical protein